MSTAKVVDSFLSEYQARLGIDGSANVLVLDADIAEALQQYCKGLSSFSQPRVEVAGNLTPNEAWPHPETEYSHIFASISSVDTEEDLLYLKFIQYSLRWKGIAILLFQDKAKSTSSDSLVKWIEGASFERGKIRVLGEQSPECSLAFAMKWDALTA